MQWIEVTIKTAPGAIDLVCDRLTVLGFDSFIVDDQDQFHEFLEENRQYWDYVDEGLEQQMQGLSQIRLYLEEGPAVPETISHLKDQLAALRAQYPATDFGSLDVQLANVKDEDWENNWKQYYQPLPIGEKLLVVPEWLHPENPEHRVEVLLDPGMIFGTGAHASTQMCMRELERAIQGGEHVLDLGSGSFSSENQVPLNIIADWTAKTVDSNTVSVTVTVSAQSYSLHLEPTKSLHISLNGEYKTVDVAALTYDGTDLAKNELGSATFDIDLPAGSSNSYTLAVEWQFGGFYFNTPIEVLECGGTISLSR